MKKTPTGLRVVPVIAALVAALAVPVAVRAATVEEEYGGYYRMVHAAEVCAYPALDTRDGHGHAFTASTKERMVADEAQKKIAAIIDDRLDLQLSASEKIGIITTSRHEVNVLIGRQGCGGSGVAALVDAYNQQLGVMP